MVFKYFKKSSQISEDSCIETSPWYKKVYDKLKGLFKVGSVKVKVPFDNQCVDLTTKYSWIKPKESAKNLESTLEYLLEKSNGDLEKAAELANKIKQQITTKYGPGLSTFDLAYYILKGVIKYDSSMGVIFIDKEQLEELYREADPKKLDKYASNLWFKTRLIFGGDRKGESYSSLLEVLKRLEKKDKVSYKKSFDKERGLRLFWSEEYFKR